MGSVGSDGAGVAEDEMPIERNAGLIMAVCLKTPINIVLCSV